MPGKVLELADPLTGLRSGSLSLKEAWGGRGGGGEEERSRRGSEWFLVSVAVCWSVFENARENCSTNSGGMSSGVES